MTALLSNDLMDTFGRADDDNRNAIYAYCMFLYNEAPPGCYGSPEKVRAWHRADGLYGQRRADAKGETP